MKFCKISNWKGGVKNVVFEVMRFRSIKIYFTEVLPHYLFLVYLILGIDLCKH